jgi:hypothetical protein
MAQIKQQLLRAIALAAALSLHALAQDPGPAVYPEPKATPLISVGEIKPQKIDEVQDLLANTWGNPGQRNGKGKTYPAQGLRSDGEVPDSPWYENRQASRRRSIPELVRGPGTSNAPSLEGPWVVVSAKAEGVMPGFVIRDVRGRRYVLKFDPPAYPELASGADMVGSKFFHALGYYVPEDYIVYFERRRLKADTAPQNHAAPREKDIDAALAFLKRGSNGRYRALASFFLEGKLVGPFRFNGTRPDDPNDTIPHEHRRELRGLFVFCAWLNHSDSKSGNTLDTVVTKDGISFVKHYLIDFGGALGSGSIGKKSARDGYEYLIDPAPSLTQLVALGFYVPKWARVRQSKSPAVGRFEAEAFEPEKWKPFVPNPAFLNRLPDDTRWAARQVAAFTDDEIRAMVEAGQYTDPQAVDWITKTLIARRNKIVSAYLKGAASTR